MEGIGKNISTIFRNNPKIVTKASEQTIDASKSFEPISPEVKQNKRRKNAVIIGGVGLTLASYGAIFYRKNIINFAHNFAKKTFLKVKEQRQNGLHLWDAISVNIARNIDRAMNSTQMFVNFSAMKDSLSNKIARTLKMGKLCDKMSETWEKLAKKAVKANYNSCEKSFNKTQKQIFEIIKEARAKEDLGRIVKINGENYTVGQLIHLIEKNIVESKQIYNKNFSIEAFEKRNSILKDHLKGINEKFYETYTSFDYYKKQEFTRFTVEEWLAPIKLTYQKDLAIPKTIISNNIDDKFLNSFQLLKNLDRLITTRDTKSRSMLKEIFSKLGEYRKLSGAKEKISRQELNKDIESRINLLLENISKNPQYEENVVKNMEAISQELKFVINSEQKGKLQESLTYLKAILPKEQYRKIKKQVYETTDQLNNVTKGEGDLYFDKLRDIVLGSAFSDIVFGMITPFATMGTILALEDTKEDRISTTLRLGIPLIGGIATSTAFLFMLASGGKALVMSSLIGGGLNILGTFADEKLIKNKSGTKIETKHPKANDLINKVNQTTTILSTDPTTLVMNKAINKGMDESLKYAYLQYNKLKEMSTDNTQKLT